ncbi:MAG: hypothetical protein HKN25_03560 [Pyrinomonadaceae bacterium]|nr:hypothetical protein [Pyrinomonadaceae bacterium]
MTYIETLLPIALMLFGGLIVYLVGFGVGRRSAYRDLDLNLRKPPRHNLRDEAKWNSRPGGVLTPQTTK